MRMVMPQEKQRAELTVRVYSAIIIALSTV